MKNITLSAEETLIERARARAAKERSTLNDRFRGWLETYVANDRKPDFEHLMRRLAHVRVGRRFSRDDLNERR